MTETTETASPKVVDAERVPEPQLAITGEDVALIGVGSAGVVLVVLVGGAIAGNAVLLSLLSVGGGAILWIKLPKQVKDVPVLSHGIRVLPLSPALKERILTHDWKASVLKHELLLDIGVSLGVVALLGTTLTGLVAAGLTGLSVSVLLRLSHVAKRVSANAEAFKAKFAI